MPLDFAGLAAISGTNNWDAIRNAKARNLQIIQMQEGLAQKGMEEQIAANQKIQEYENTLSEISSKLLPPSVDKLRAEEEDVLRPALLKAAKKGLMEAGGDANKWLRSGGINALNKYKQGLLMGDATQDGLHSAFNHAQAIADQKEGKIWRPIPDGKGGEMEYGDMLKGFQDGTIKNLTYNGSYDRPDFGGLREMFSKVEGKNPYSPQPVDAYTFENAALYVAKEKGLNNADAVHAAKRATADYVEMIKAGGQPFQFKTRQYHVPGGYGYGAEKDQSNAVVLGTEWGKIARKEPTAFIDKTMANVDLGKFIYNQPNETVTEAIGTDGKPKKSLDANGNPIARMVTKSTVPVEKSNVIEGYDIDDNGDVLVSTTETLLNKGGTVDGQRVDANGFIPLNNGMRTKIAKANGVSLKVFNDAFDKEFSKGTKSTGKKKIAGF